MVRLEQWQKIQWLKEYKARQKWLEKNPGKLYKTLTLGGPSISRYTCTFCGERYYYITNGHDKDAPQYHKNKKGRWLILCHACWHLKGFYVEHQGRNAFEGPSGCRFCHITSVIKQAARKRRKAVAEKESAPESGGLGTTVASSTNWQPTGLRSGNAVSSGRKRGGDVQDSRPARRTGRKVSRRGALR
jgi:hypothetical protein